MQIVFVPALFTIIGMIGYVVLADARAKEIFRAMMWAGFFTLALAYSNHAVRF